MLVAAGFGLLSTIDHTTNMVLLGVFLAVLGLGIGMTMQNLVLAVQNTVAATDLGAASSAVAFFRSLGGTIGVSVLGAVLSARVSTLITAGLPAGAATQAGGGDVGLANLADAPAPVQDLIRVSYGDATGRIFLVAAILSVVTVLAVVFIKEVALRTESGDERARAERTGGPAADPRRRTAPPRWTSSWPAGTPSAASTPPRTRSRSPSCSRRTRSSTVATRHR